MNIGFIGFGQVNKTLAEKLKTKHYLYVSIENRSKKTLNNIKIHKINTVLKDEELKEKCDLIISANSPKQAINIAKKFEYGYDGLFLDLNNINPITTRKINNILNDNYIDGAIIGNILNTELLLISGSKAKKLEFFNDIIKTKIISKNTGDASSLKMLRSIYTKGLSALLIETFNNADELDLTNQLWDILEITENKDFKKQNTSRIKNSKKYKKRKLEEIIEIKEFLEYMESRDNKMINSTYSIFKHY